MTSDPTIMLGKPVIDGTRITVELLLERLAVGESREQIPHAYPHLPEGSIEAAVRYFERRARLPDTIADNGKTP